MTAGPKRTEITIETTRVTVIRSRSSRDYAFCGQCSAIVQQLTLPQVSAKINIQGSSPDGTHTVGKAELVDFGDGAAIMNGTLTRPSIDNRFIIPCILVMRPFAVIDGSIIPDPSGRYAGAVSTADMTGQIIFLTNPPDPVSATSFDGSIEITIDGETHTLQLLGTISGTGRVIGIAHRDGAGHMIVDAILDPATDSLPPTLRGTFKFELEHGIEYEGTFEAPFARSTAS